MKLSIIIKCSDDERIFRCLKSIDEDVEVVVAMTPNKKLENRFKQMGIKYCITPKGNLSVTSNAGIRLATHDKFIIMDSDSVFKKRCIRKLNEKLESNLVVRPRIVFLMQKNSLLSQVLANGRDFENRKELVAYTPGLGLRKELTKHIGRFFFQEKVCWSEDSELDNRIKEAKIPICEVPEAVVYHDPVTLRHELRGAFQFGVGKRQAVVFSGEEGVSLLKNFLQGNQLKYGLALFREKGILTVLYMVVWKFFYNLGYYYQVATNYF